ncbi:MAG TPA: universal stress protein [Chitinophagaceae bacterium]|nr:universal stress protein [Chitinophagaceae bacterium]
MHLLIALDSSPLNERITGFLKHFFDQLKEVPILSFIHVIDSRIIGAAADVPGVTMNYDVLSMSLEDEDVLVRQLRKDASEIIEDVQRELGVDGTIDFPLDDPVSALAEACRQKKPDFLIMGTHSRKGINHFLFGNFAEKVLRRVNVPLIVIPEKSLIKDFETVKFEVK